MALNLSRNSRVFFTTNVNTYGVVQNTGFTAANTQEIQVLDGFSFSQKANADTVTIKEAGTSPVRGQRSFNSSLAPVDFTLSTYVRPYKNGTTSITAEESVLWNALLGVEDIKAVNTLTTTGVTGVTYAFSAGNATLTISGSAMPIAGLVAGTQVVVGGLSHATDSNFINAAGAITGTPSATSIVITLVNPKPAGAAIAAITMVTAGTVMLYKSAWAPVLTTSSYVSTGGSNFNQLQKFGLIFLVDTVYYVIDNAAMGQVSLDFGLDAIATLAWTGQATALSNNATAGAAALAAATPKNTAAAFITNKLSTVSLTLVNALGAAAAGTLYNVALTSGSITINNNITYVTPANLATINTPITYFTGTRAITGTLNAYLKTGLNNETGNLLTDTLSAIVSGNINAIEPMAALTINVGGPNNTHIVLDMPSVTITVPSVDVQAVVSTSINFTAAGSTPSATANANAFALDETNELAIRYYAV
jgi:hypothetical protein